METNWASGSHSIVVGGLERTFLLDLPSNLEPGAPLILVFHGYTGSAARFRQQAGFTPLAEKNGFVVAYPQGTKDSKGNPFFNVGYDLHKDSTVDDVQFARELSQRLVQDLELDPDLIFSTGMSNGGDMSYVLANQANPFIRSIAPVAGCMMVEGNESIKPNKRISIMEVHGTDDTITRWDGDLGNRDGWGPYFGTDAVMKFWVDAYNLKEYETIPLSKSSNDEQPILLHRWSTEADNTEVLLYEIKGGRHIWPNQLGDPNVSMAGTSGGEKRFGIGKSKGII